MICDFCEKIILADTTIFKGFDCTFCSSHCRNEIANKNFVRDPKLSEFKKWYKYKQPPNFIECTPKRTKSIIDFENRNNAEYKINISNKYLKNNISSNNTTNDTSYSFYDYSCNYINIINKFKFINFIYGILSIKIF